MPTHHITILNGNPNNGVLTLDIPHLKTAKTSDKVKWRIRAGSNVESIVNIIDKSSSKNVWTIRPKNNNSWEGTINSKDDMPDPYDYEYSIRWKTLDGRTPPDHDPKITINPSFGEHDPPFEEKLLIPLIISALMVTAVALMFLRKKSK